MNKVEYSELSHLGDQLDLSTAWLIRRAVSELISRHRHNITLDLPLTSPYREDNNHAGSAGD